MVGQIMLANSLVWKFLVTIMEFEDYYGGYDGWQFSIS